MKYNTIIIFGANSELGLSIIKKYGEKYVIYAISSNERDINDVNNIKWEKKIELNNYNGIEAKIKPEHDKRVIINCIGNFVGRREIQNYSDKEINCIINTNINSFLYAYKIFVPQMINVKCGAFVTFGSISNIYNYPNIAIFNAAKEALKSLIISAANEQHKNNIHFIHLNLSTLKIEKERQFASADVFKSWLSPEDVAEVLYSILEIQTSQVNKTIIDVYNYYERYYKEGYYSRSINK